MLHQCIKFYFCTKQFEKEKMISYEQYRKKTIQRKIDYCFVPFFSSFFPIRSVPFKQKILKTRRRNLFFVFFVFCQNFSSSKKKKREFPSKQETILINIPNSSIKCKTFVWNVRFILGLNNYYFKKCVNIKY